MSEKKEKTKLHKNNKHKRRYNLQELARISPDLSKHIILNKYNDESIDFFNPAAVKQLNKALLLKYYNISYWNIPENYLCPPIPGRADYIHHISDLIKNSNNGKLPEGHKIKCLDIGVGASCIYPIIGIEEYGWSFIGAEIDQVSINSAIAIINKNRNIDKKVTIRTQKDEKKIFDGIIKPNEQIDITICNPPFHASAQEAMTGTMRKLKNLKGKKQNKTTLNFGGTSNELWTKGGEERFIRTMISESKQFGNQCRWFTTIVSKQSNLKGIYKILEKSEAIDVVTIPMSQGNKISRIIAWTFLKQNLQYKWKKDRWF